MLPQSSRHGYYVYAFNELEQKAERRAEKRQRKRDSLHPRYCCRCLAISALLAVVAFYLAGYTVLLQGSMQASMLFSSVSEASRDHAAATPSLASAPRIVGEAAHDRIQVGSDWAPEEKPEEKRHPLLRSEKKRPVFAAMAEVIPLAAFAAAHNLAATAVQVAVPPPQKPASIEETTTVAPDAYAFDPDAYAFARNDCEWFRNWSLGKSSCKRLPRVLIWTYSTEDLLTRFHNEAYWKSCYAHAHGFDIEFTGVKKVNGVKEYNASGSSSADDYYSDENMWAWIPPIKAHLSSGKYDYVYYTGADTLIHDKHHFTFPVWAWDAGHDLTIMDQNVHPWGLNINSVLFRASSWSLTFLDTLYSHRKNFNLQGDNGPYMETILTCVGGLLYKDDCAGPLVLDMPSAIYLRSTEGTEEYQRRNKIYSDCFFNELDRLVGPYGSRKSEHIGFTNTMKEGHLPWANCWALVRNEWPDPDKNCFAAHWNGPKPPGHRSYATGGCPDPSFNWELDPYNIDNPRRPKYN